MIPILVGVGDLKNQTKELRSDGADEPLTLILEAISTALADTGLESGGKAGSASTSPLTSTVEQLQAALDDVSVVRPWSWPYPDLPGLIAERLGIHPRHSTISPHGGNQPAKLLDEACRRISRGESRAAVVCGGEALDSLRRYVQKQQVPPPGWTPVDVEAFASAALRPPSEGSLKGVHGVGAPIQVYPLYENALRAAEGRSFEAMQDESAAMYAEFAQVSANNSNSWNYGRRPHDKDTIATVTPENRMICLPYPLLMNAFNNVNIAGACIATSTEFATQLGIPHEKWVYVLGGAGTAESEEFFMRPTFTASPAIQQSLDSALKVTGVSKNQVDLFDFYSCFPVVPKLACRHLGLPTVQPPKPITLLGGLTSFGGAGNNYSMHAVTEMTRRLRHGGEMAGNGKAKTGLILANGGVLSYQHAVLLSAEPGKQPYPAEAPLPEHLDELPLGMFLEAPPEGEAVIETYTVDFARDGSPKRGHVVGRLVGDKTSDNNKRFIANHADQQTLSQLSSLKQAVVGRRGWVRRDTEKPGRNLFSFESEQKL